MSRTSKHQGDTPNGRTPGPADSVIGSEVVLAESHPEILDEDGGLAIDGGKLPGRHDDFDGELDQNRGVPGADGDAGAKPHDTRDLSV
ncbi:MAG: hypothetical protein ACO1SV_09260 [Fimbriimonas sp.]